MRFLKAGQIYGRLKNRIHRPKPNRSPAPLINCSKRAFQPAARRTPSLIGKRTFKFLQEVGSLQEDGWDNPVREKLWRYNQHYFDDLNARNATDRSEWHWDLMERWIDENPPGIGTGWEPYPTSLRIVNWVKWFLTDASITEEAMHSLAIQARWLTTNIEWHLLGNHLFANAKALVFAGLFFQGDEADEWLRIGREILLKQIPEQILPDGGQFELSPMYHALALEDVLDLINIVRATWRPDNADLILALEARVNLMIGWLAAMSHPDDQIAFFNDATFGIAPDNAELRAYAQRLAFCWPTAVDDLTYLEDSGYVRLACGPAVLIADMAEVGPSYLPGHAHADTLAFECSVFGQRLIVNSGISLYGTSAERVRQRGTAAHSTVGVRGEDSSEVWSGFRVARRAHVLRRSCRREGDALVAEGAHDGYRRLISGLTHFRAWQLIESGLAVIDEVAPADEAEAIFHIHPAVSVEMETSRSGRLILGDGRPVRWVSETDVVVAHGAWHPGFGECIPNRNLVIPLKNGKSQLELFWL